MSRFNVGDRVRRVARPLYPSFGEVGEEYTVTSIRGLSMGLMELTAIVDPTAFELVLEGEEGIPGLRIGERVFNTSHGGHHPRQYGVVVKTTHNAGYIRVEWDSDGTFTNCREDQLVRTGKLKDKQVRQTFKSFVSKHAPLN